jgi:hypothetical protein
MILAHSNTTSGKLSFNEDLDDGYEHLLDSSLRTQCAVLTTLVNYDEIVRDGKIKDLPFKLVNTITQARKQKNYWENTQENMFCMNALIDYARVYEKDKPNMAIRSWLGAEAMPLLVGEELSTSMTAQFTDVKDMPVTFAHRMTSSDPGQKTAVTMTREGQGRMYYTVRMNYASLAEKATAINAGIEVNREYSVERNGAWVLLKSPMEIKTGELVRVDLYLSLPAPRYFVVVDDPVPGGLEPVNRELATASKVDANKAQSDYAGGSLWYTHGDWTAYGVSLWSFYHKELRHHAAIYYSEYLPTGNYHLSYVAQAIAPGEFSIMPTHSEEMYNPETFGKAVPAQLKVTRD